MVDHLTKKPVFIIVDVQHIVSFDNNNNWLFDKMPIQDIITIFTSVPVYSDCSEHLLEAFCKIFENDDLTSAQTELVDFVFEIIMDMFYTELTNTVGDYGNEYVFHSWLDSTSVVLSLTQNN